MYSFIDFLKISCSYLNILFQNFECAYYVCEHQIVTRMNDHEQKYQQVMTDLIMRRQKSEELKRVIEEDLKEIRGGISKKISGSILRKMEYRLMTVVVRHLTVLLLLFIPVLWFVLLFTNSRTTCFKQIFEPDHRSCEYRKFFSLSLKLFFLFSTFWATLIFVHSNPISLMLYL